MPTITNLASTSGSYRLLPNTSDKVLAFDIETDGLLYSKESPVSKLWCVVIFDCKEKQYYEYRPDQIDQACKHLSEATILIGHNIISYDIPVLQTLYPNWKSTAQVIDTFTLASLVYPKDKLLELDTSIFAHIDKSQRGRQGLRAWGQRLQNLKGDHQDWSQFSEEMLSYCKNDVLVTVQLYTYLVNTLKKQDPELKNLRFVAIEHDLAQILMLQMHTGWTFNVDAALDLDEKLRNRFEEIALELQETIPPTVERSVFVPKRDNKRLGYLKDIAVVREKTVPFNPGSRQQILQFFKSKYDWQPKEKTEKGNYKVNDDILEELPYPEAKLLAEYFLLQKRLGQLSDGNKSWLGLVDKNNVIHGSIVSSGCVTGRSVHRDPNLGQVPNAIAPYGPECRSLFQPTPGFMLLGSDAKALELRCLGGYLAHYDNGYYASKVIDPDVDIHIYNQEKFGVETRDLSKRLIYCVLYGGGPTKTGSIIAPNESTEYQKQIGIKTLDNFYKEIPALKHLKDDVENTINNRGYLRGLDGRELYVRSAYKGLNLLLQSAGAIIMKRVGIEIYEGLTSAGLQYGIDWTQNAYVHDEYQNSVLQHHIETAKKIILDAYLKAGQFLEFKCPIEGDVKVGTNWYETH
jgi:DNA polymerase I-like protein with 3'-5' exonuclease and polymerase domains